MNLTLSRAIEWDYGPLFEVHLAPVEPDLKALSLGQIDCMLGGLGVQGLWQDRDQVGRSNPAAIHPPTGPPTQRALEPRLDCPVRSDADHLGDFRHLLLEMPLDAELQGHGRRWAADAGPMQADLDDAVLGHVHQFEIAAVGLDHGSQVADDAGDAVFERFSGGCELGHRITSWPGRNSAHGGDYSISECQGFLLRSGVPPGSTGSVTVRAGLLAPAKE